MRITSWKPVREIQSKRLTNKVDKRCPGRKFDIDQRTYGREVSKFVRTVN